VTIAFTTMHERAPALAPISVERTDAALVPLLQRRDPVAAALAWRRFSPFVGGAVRRMLGPARDEEDVVQDVFLRFFTTVVRLRDPALVRSFLFGICVRVVRKEIRRRGRRGRLGTLVFTEGERHSESGDPDAREALRRLGAIVETLRDDTRAVFVARVIERKALADVARQHGVSISTVQRRLTRATSRVSASIKRDPLLASYLGARALS
jgi:RNA polymerase sigma-70 factor (ECF subfamily)